MNWYVDATLQLVPRNPGAEETTFLPVATRHLHIEGEMIKTTQVVMKASKRKGKWVWSVYAAVVNPPPAFHWHGYDQTPRWELWERFHDEQDARAFCRRMLADEGERAFHGLMNAKLIRI